MSEGPVRPGPERTRPSHGDGVGLLSDLAAALLEAKDEQEIHAHVAAGVGRAVGGDALIMVSGVDPERRRTRPPVCVGPAASVATLAEALGCGPDELCSVTSASLREAVTTQHLQRLAGGVAGLARGPMTPGRAAAAERLGPVELWGLGFGRVDLPGSICIIAAPATVESVAVELEAIGRLASVALERLRSAETLRENEERYRALFEQSVDGIYLHDFEGRVIDVNQVATEQSGYTRTELLALTVFDFHPPGIDPEVIKGIWRSWQPGQRVTIEGFHRRKDGTVYPVEISTGVIRHRGEQLLLAVTRDISLRKQAEEEHRRLTDQLAQSHKLESIGRLAGGVAHDFNNMLTAILGNVRLLRDRLPKGSPLADDLALIGAAAARSAELTRQLLAFARKQTISPRELDLNQAVASTLQLLRRVIGEQVELVWAPGDQVGATLLDPAQLDQILTNLCINARDAIDGPGRIAIETGVGAIDDVYCAKHPDALPGDYVLLCVSDNGRGMDQETLARVFEPFFTTKVLGHGTGLGLSTVHGIVKQNGGHITAESEIGRGTTFKVYLPVARGAAPRVAPEAAPVTLSRGGETVLLVEDEPTVLTVSARMLEQLGYRVITADGPQRALNLAREHVGPLDLLITDVVMPEMNGRDLARAMRSLYPALRCLFMSGYTANVIAQAGIVDQGVRFLQKPFTLEQLAAKVREAVDG